MRAFLIAAGIAVALFMAPVASAQSIGVQGISSVQGKTGRTSQLQINIVFDPVSVASANFPGSSNITEAQFKAAAAEAVTNLQNALFLKATFYVEVYWISSGSAFFSGLCTMDSGADSQSCYSLTHFTSWSAFLNALNANAVTSNAKSAYNNLPVSNPLPSGVFPWTPPIQQIAFGLATTGGAGAPDCGIAINTAFTYTTTQNGGAGPIAAGTLDLVGMFEHEITECMGRARNGGTNGFIYLALDPMTYSGASTLNFTTTGTAYFSVDGGVTNINTFNQSTGTGDVGDWSGLTRDAFNAVNAAGQLNLLSIGDIREMDALGYQCGSC